MPVLCLGNFTLGGSGKTPLAIAVALRALERGLNPAIILRGYGGQVGASHFVSVHDSARLVGDEALLLARVAPTVVGSDRTIGAKALEKEGHDFLILDDGFQSRKIHADYSLLLVDSWRGLGNEKVFPAGPLRAPLRIQLSYADAIVIIGEGEKGDKAIRYAARAAKTVDHIIFESISSMPVAGKKFLAFAGIGNPDKFYASIRKLGGDIVMERAFPDHHFLNAYDVQDLLQTAAEKNLTLATTAKDYMRCSTDLSLKKNLGEDKFIQFLKMLTIFDIRFKDDNYCDRLISLTEQAFFKRKYGNSSFSITRK